MALALMDSQYGFRFDTPGIVGFLVVLLLTALFIYFAAKLLGETEGYGTALVVALVGGILANLVSYFVAGLLGLILAVVVWALVAAAAYHTRWLKGLLIGFLAWVLFFLAQLAVAALR
ncbi:MAG: hypothetical protein QOD77_652 [Thermoplasmata archaeon]|jgi:hypothetical protein|nr:hypothetical protein [Thermoplasmata archaeon]